VASRAVFRRARKQIGKASKPTWSFRAWRPTSTRGGTCCCHFNARRSADPDIARSRLRQLRPTHAATSQRMWSAGLTHVPVVCRSPGVLARVRVSMLAGESVDQNARVGLCVPVHALTASVPLCPLSYRPALDIRPLSISARFDIGPDSTSAPASKSVRLKISPGPISAPANAASLALSDGTTNW